MSTLAEQLAKLVLAVALDVKNLSASIAAQQASLDAKAALSNPVFSGTVNLGQFTVASLPTAPAANALAFATNGRKVGEAAGFGTGVPVYFSSGFWRAFSTDAQITA